MQFSYSNEASSEELIIKEDLYKYLFKARRHKVADKIYFRNLVDKNLYLYQVNYVDKKQAKLNLLSYEEKILENKHKLHLAWCVVDPKTIEKNISSLNELGVDKITFIYCDYSQNSFKINLDKLNKILINSSCQCGRSSIIKIDICKCLDEFLLSNEDCFLLDFSQENIENKRNEINTLIVGCEGGFSKEERKKFKNEKIVGFDSNLILKSETAVISSVSKIII